MLTDFISTIAAGAGVACIIFIANHLSGRFSGRKLPTWVLPAAIGLAMLGYSIWNEYTWFPRMRDALPEGVVVASAPTERAMYRPWSYLFPSVSRFIAVDRATAARSTSEPQVFVANAVVFQRWQPERRIPQAFDCANNARADLMDGATLSTDGVLKGAEWQKADDDPLVAAACSGG
jgi:hypothetical protein